jgi:chromosome partitioning protein
LRLHWLRKKRKRGPLQGLLIDLDPQAHATFGFGLDFDSEDSDQATIAQVLGEERLSLEEATVSTTEDNLTICPSSIQLAKSAVLLQTRPFKELVLSKALAPIQNKFDYIIIDCQPNLDVLPTNALVAANCILIPTELTGHSLKGLSDLLTTMQSIKSDDVYDWRILLTSISGKAEERQSRAVKILEPIKDRIFKTKIRKTEAIEKSQMEAEDAEHEDELLPVVLSKKWNRGAQDYRALAREILQLWPV